MKVAVIYNRDSLKVINRFGMQNREKYRVEAIKRITDALKAGKHQVKAFEGDKDLIDNLEEFMPAVVKGERPGMALNLAYGIQGQARYTHIPSILEMVGIPYVGSGPLAHSLSLDKVIAKVLFQQNGLPTPEFAVLEGPDFADPKLPYPLIVKPRSEADSFGLQIVHDEQELRTASEYIFQEFEQPILVERYIDGREINVGLLGNPPQAFPPIEIVFGEGPRIYSNADKGGRSGRTVQMLPANLDEETTARAQDIATRAFTALGCFDCARVDMRLDEEGNLYLLEINSLPSLGYRGSFVIGAQETGLDFKALVNRLLEVASTRYFGTAVVTPIPKKNASPQDNILRYLTSQRDQIERRIKELVSFSSRISDPIGIRELVQDMNKHYQEMGLLPVKELTDEHVVRTWETSKGMDGGTLLIVQLDVALGAETPYQVFRNDPEWLYGEAIGISRAPLVMLEFALRALRNVKKLQQQHLGILLYSDDSHDCRYSCDRIAAAAARVKQVIILRPGTPAGKMITSRRGLRKYQLVVEGTPRSLGQAAKKPDILRWTCNRIEEMSKLSSRKDRLEIFSVDLLTTRFPDLLPHRTKVNLLLSYPEFHLANETEASIHQLLGKGGPNWQLHLISDYPPMPERKRNTQLFRKLETVANAWEIPIERESSASPSVAGFVSERTDVLCGFGPIVRDPYTPHESVQRSSLFQRTLLLSQFLIDLNKDG